MKLIYFTIFLLFIFNLFELSECGNKCLGNEGKTESYDENLTIEQFNEELTKLDNLQRDWNTIYGKKKTLSSKASNQLDFIRGCRHELSG